MTTSSLSSQDVETLRTIAEKEWGDAVLGRDWDKALSFCADDIVYMVPDQPALRGHAAMRSFMEGFPKIDWRGSNARRRCCEIP